MELDRKLSKNSRKFPNNIGQKQIDDNHHSKNFCL